MVGDVTSHWSEPFPYECGRADVLWFEGALKMSFAYFDRPEEWVVGFLVLESQDLGSAMLRATRGAADYIGKTGVGLTFELVDLGSRLGEQEVVQLHLRVLSVLTEAPATRRFDVAKTFTAEKTADEEVNAYSVNAASVHLGISRSELYEKIREGRLPRALSLIQSESRSITMFTQDWLTRAKRMLEG